MIKATPERNLGTIRPAVAALWDYKANHPLTPADFAPMSGKKVHWSCSAGHKFTRKISQMKNEDPCPHCNPRASIVPGVNDLATLRPDLAAEWSALNELPVSHVGTGSRYLAVWVCDKGHYWEYAVKERISNGTTCLFCSHRRLFPGFNDLATCHPELAPFWADENGKMSGYTRSGDKAVLWRCREGHEWRATVRAQLRRNRCPACQGTVLVPGVNDLATMRPDVLRFWDYKKNVFSPAEVRYRSHRIAHWKCDQGHEWTESVNARTFKGEDSVCFRCFPHGRPVSSGEKEVLGFIRSMLPLEEIRTNCRDIIPPYELDIAIPSLSLAIEYNGNYWHGERMVRRGIEPGRYHERKVRMCEAAGLRLAFVWESDWREDLAGMKAALTGAIRSPLSPVPGILCKLEYRA